MKRTIEILTILLIALTSTSCVKSKLEAIYNKQESQIDSYLEKQKDKRIARNGASNRLVLVEGQGDSLSRSGYVSFYYAGYTFSGSFSSSNLFVTNHQATAEQSNWTLTDQEYQIMEINLKEAELLQGLKDGLVGVKAGEECEILFSGKYAFGNDSFGIIPANSALLYKIWVVGVTND